MKCMKIRKLYRSEYARNVYIRNLRNLLPFMPRPGSGRYKVAESLIINGGLKISVEEFYLCKTLLFITGLVFLISVQTTNAYMTCDGILKDMNIGVTLVDTVGRPGSDAISTEKAMFLAVDQAISKRDVSVKELNNSQNSQMYIEYIETLIRNKWEGLQEDYPAAARRLYNKLVKVRLLQGNYLIYLTSLIAAILLYFAPNIVGMVKLRLIEDKRDWEILNYIYVFSIFGRMPPFNIKTVLANTLAVSDIFRPLVLEALNEVKSGKGEKSFDNLLGRVEDQEMYELFEAMKLSMNTGLLNIVDDIDEMAANRLKWLEIKSIKRRKTKQVIAMVPVAIVMLLAAVYFSYSLSILSNPMNFIK